MMTEKELLKKIVKHARKNCVNYYCQYKNVQFMQNIFVQNCTFLFSTFCTILFCPILNYCVISVKSFVL